MVVSISSARRSRDCFVILGTVRICVDYGISNCKFLGLFSALWISHRNAKIYASSHTSDQKNSGEYDTAIQVILWPRGLKYYSFFIDFAAYKRNQRVYLMWLIGSNICSWVFFLLQGFHVRVWMKFCDLEQVWSIWLFVAS
jgi:hypothetical protein